MVGGPGFFRFFLQPAVAILLGIIHGRRDRRAGRSAYLAGLIHVREGRAQRIRDGLRSVAVPLVVALIAAFTFQYMIRSRIFIGYGLLYATLFVLVPYLVARGLAQRLTRPGGPGWRHEARNSIRSHQ